MAEPVTVSVEADLEPFRQSLEQLGGLAESFGSQLAGSLKGAIVDGRNLDDVLRRIALNLAGMALSQGFAPLQGLAGQMFGSLFNGVVPFAKGGIVSSPAYFPTGGGLGVMGEAGAEAVLPLSRGSDGRLGVAGGSGTAAVNVVFNVTAPDPAAFRKSEAQITGMLARAVSRGSRTL